MINGLEGIPGSGKSYEAVVYHVLPMLGDGRKVITNLPLVVELFAAIDPSYRALIELRIKPSKVLGTWDADRVDEQGKGMAFELFKDGPQAVDAKVTVFGHVWDFYSDWKHPETGQGPVFIVDEAHVAMPDIGTDKQVIEWFKLHRHFNADVLLMTQSFRDMNQPIARLMAMLVVCRKADILGKSDKYIRKVKAGYRGAVISTEERPYKAQYFCLYKSHTQGNSVAESAAKDVKPMIVWFNRIKWAVLSVGLVLMVWAFWPNPERNVFGARVRPVATEPQKKALPRMSVDEYKRAKAVEAGQPVATAVTLAPETPASESKKKETVDPLFGKLVHLTGEISKRGRLIQTFVISSAGRRVFDLTSEDLQGAGYTVDVKGPCMAFVKYEDVIRPVTCDAPAYGGTTNKPIVIDTASGRRSDTPPSAQPGVAANSPQQQVGPAHASYQEPTWSQGLAERNAQVRSVFGR